MFVELAAVRFHDYRQRLIPGERRDLILKPAELLGNVFRKQIRPRRKHLPECHEYRSELFQRLAQRNLFNLTPVRGNQSLAHDNWVSHAAHVNNR